MDHVFNVVQGVVLAGATAGLLHGIKRVPWVDALEPKVVPEGAVRLRHNPHYLPAEDNPLVLLQGLPGGHFDHLLSSRARVLMDATGLHIDQLRRLNLERGPCQPDCSTCTSVLSCMQADPICVVRRWSRRCSRCVSRLQLGKRN